jgi:hypothetical protein
VPAHSVTVQECGCIALPEEIANALGMQPGVELAVNVSAENRSITLTSPNGTSASGPVELANCPIKA